MITAQAPLRISLAGGGTDTPLYFQQYGGLVVSFAVKPRVRIGLRQVKDGRSLNILWSKRHLETMGLDSEKIELRCLDSGINSLGASSAFSVACFAAMAALEGDSYDANKAARRACELNLLTYGKASVGYQDEYAVAHGGLNSIRFSTSTVSVEPWGDDVGRTIAGYCLLFRLPVKKKYLSSEMLQKSNGNPLATEYRHRLREAAESLDNVLARGEPDPVRVGAIVSAGWDAKKEQNEAMTNPEIDNYYDKAIGAGACGAKVCGSGGSGCLLIVSELFKQDGIREALRDLEEVVFEYESEGVAVHD